MRREEIVTCPNCDRKTMGAIECWTCGHQNPKRVQRYEVTKLPDPDTIETEEKK